MKERIKRILLSLMAAAGFVSCDTRLSPAEYLHYVEHPGHGFNKGVVVDQWKFRAQYKPPAYIFLRETRKTAFAQQELKERTEQLKNWRFFNVYISNERIRNASPLKIISSDVASYNGALQYYLNENALNFSLHIGNSVVHPLVYTFENNYNLTPVDVMVVGFKVEGYDAERHDMTLVYNDKMFGSGIIKFSFAEDAVRREQKIRIINR